MLLHASPGFILHYTFHIRTEAWTRVFGCCDISHLSSLARINIVRNPCHITLYQYSFAEIKNWLKQSPWFLLNLQNFRKHTLTEPRYLLYCVKRKELLEFSVRLLGFLPRFRHHRHDENKDLIWLSASSYAKTQEGQKQAPWAAVALSNPRFIQ